MQKHDASHLHYDFRLELDGVLKSWAVPKGPSLDPEDKRLAIMVEDHPVEYGSFEGTIPRGEYGGGTVLLWDRGSWEPDGDASEGLANGKLKFRLHGERLRGGWSLIRIRGESDSGEKANWLLIKEADEEARSSREYNVTKLETASVATGRDLQEIEGDSKSRRWSSAKRKGGRVARGSGGGTTRNGSAGSNSAVRPGARGSVAKLDLSGGRAAPLPDSVRAELALLTDSVPDTEEWLHEIKFDGYRIFARKHGSDVRLISRNNKEWTHRFPTIASAVAALPLRSALLDGEIVAVDDDGKSSFQALQRFLREKSEQRLLYYVFDALYINGRDISGVPLLTRKRVLASLLPAGGSARAVVRYSDHQLGSGARFFAEACRAGLEGVVSKRADSVYRGGRGGDWMKTKCVRRQEFVIGGFTDPQRSRVGFGALLLGVHDGSGKLRYAGRVGTGFDNKTLHALHAKLAKLETAHSPFESVPAEAERRRGVHWVRPVLVAEVTFAEWTEEGRLRHPSFEGLREDKRARDVVRELPTALAGYKPGSDDEKSVRKRRAAARNVPRRRGGEESRSPRTGMKTTRKRAGTPDDVELSNPDRILYPELKLTKAELWAYYESVAADMLPHIAGRPLTLLRCPQGHERSCFIQRHVRGTPPPGIRTIRLRVKEGEEEFMLLDDLTGLKSLVQLGALELHIWGSREHRIESPDRLVFDIDPDESLPFKRAVDAAKRVREVLSGAGLTSFVMTTGGKGLHVVVPLDPAPEVEWGEAKDFCHAVARLMVEESPDLYTSVSSKAKRRGKVYVDYLRNSRGASAIAPYSTRARAGATVAMPVAWEQLTARFDPARYSVRTVLKELKRREDPWTSILSLRQRLDLSRVE